MADGKASTGHWPRQQTWEEIMAQPPDDLTDYSRPFSQSDSLRNSPSMDGDTQLWKIHPGLDTPPNEGFANDAFASIAFANELESLSDGVELASGTVVLSLFHATSPELSLRPPRECPEEEQMNGRKLALADTCHQDSLEVNPAFSSLIHGAEPTRVEQNGIKATESDGQGEAYTEAASRIGLHQLELPVAVAPKSPHSNPTPLPRHSQSCHTRTKPQIRKKKQLYDAKERQNGLQSTKWRSSQSKPKARSAPTAVSRAVSVRGGMKIGARSREAKKKWFEAMEKQTDAARYYDNDDKDDGDYED